MRSPALASDGDALGNCANGLDAAMPPLTGMYVLFLPSFPLLHLLHHAAAPSSGRNTRLFSVRRSEPPTPFLDSSPRLTKFMKKRRDRLGGGRIFAGGSECGEHSALMGRDVRLTYAPSLPISTNQESRMCTTSTTYC